MSRRTQQGVALAIVVWFLAAMSLLVAGIVSQSRVDTRMAQTHAAKAQAVAAGDGAIELMLAALQSKQLKSFRGRGVPSMEFEVGEHAVQVVLVPASGLIDLNGAPRDLLSKLFSTHGGVEKSEAQLLADNVVKWRNQPMPGTRQAAKFRSIEDVLRVEGIGRTLVEGIRDSVVVGRVPHQGVDWQSAAPAVLAVLAGGDSSMVSSLVEQREGGLVPNKTIPRGLNARFQSVGSGNDYRVDALVTVGDKAWLRRRWVSVGSGGRGLLPWQYTGTEAARAVASIEQ